MKITRTVLGRERVYAIMKLTDLGFERNWSKITVLTIGDEEAKQRIQNEVSGNNILIHFADRVEKGIIDKGISVEEFTQLVSHENNACGFFMLAPNFQNKEVIQDFLEDSDFYKKIYPESTNVVNKEIPKDTFDPDNSSHSSHTL